MYPKIHKGRPYGVTLTAAERKAMEAEIKRELAESLRKMELEIEAMFLWYMHDKYGHGPKRLKQAYDDFATYMDELAKQYEMPDNAVHFVCKEKLRYYGIDIEEWYNEHKAKG